VETDSYSGTTADLTGVSHVTSGSAVIASYAYTYNSDGRKTQATLADGSYYTYGYDSAGQLTSESLNSGGTGTVGALHGYTYTYAYDAAGNRSSKYNGTSTESYTYDSANKLTAAGVKSYAYDNAGSVTSVYNSTSGITTTLGYDGESRMTTASNNPSSGAYSDTFGYNGMDQRYTKTDSTGSFGYTRQDDAIDSPVLSDGTCQ
jgi:YD repeat-containing protein